MRRCVLAARRPPTSARAAHRCSRRPVRMTALAAARCRVIGPSSHMGGAPINATCARAIIINRIIRRFPRGAGRPAPIADAASHGAWRRSVRTLDRAACGAAGRRATGPLPRGPATDRRGPRARSAVRAERAILCGVRRFVVIPPLARHAPWTQAPTGGRVHRTKPRTARAEARRSGEPGAGRGSAEAGTDRVGARVGWDDKLSAVLGQCPGRRAGRVG